MIPLQHWVVLCNFYMLMVIIAGPVGELHLYFSVQPTLMSRGLTLIFNVANKLKIHLIGYVHAVFFNH